MQQHKKKSSAKKKTEQVIGQPSTDVIPIWLSSNRKKAI
jgi:hypothetical protein